MNNAVQIKRSTDKRESTLQCISIQVNRLKKMSKTAYEENTQLPSAEGQRDGYPTSLSKETKHVEDAGQQNGPRPTCKGREETDGGPLVHGPCCVM